MIKVEHLGYQVVLPNGVTFYGDTKAAALKQATKYLVRRAALYEARQAETKKRQKRKPRI